MARLPESVHRLRGKRMRRGGRAVYSIAPIPMALMSFAHRSISDWM